MIAVSIVVMQILNMTTKELEPLTPDQYLELQKQMDETPDPDSVYTETGRHPELAELLRQFGYLATSRYEAYEYGVKLLKITEDSMAWKEKKPLTKGQWNILHDMMLDGVDPDETFSATGWHFDMERLLQTFGYRPSGRREVWALAKELW